ncbi:MAG: nuclear transport factor 2 family protein [Flavobacteriales bacterium]|nr:nuclear transport factor 2 family protein [Flavobacteriales bacterium]MCB9449314.1 nuclear transport factor 2 family protein [Flavobacteriales bacterium]
MFRILFLLFISSSIFAQTVPKADADSIRAIMGRQQAAWNRGDMDSFMNGYWESDSLRFLGKEGIRYGYAPTLKRYKEHYPDKAAMGQLAFTILSVEPAGTDQAMVLGLWKLQREKDTPGGAFVLIWKKINGQWVCVLDHTS